MLGYEWGNPSTMMLSGDENIQEPVENRHIYDAYANEHNYSTNNQLAHFPSSQHQHPPPESHHYHFFHNQNIQESSNNSTHFPSLYDPRGYGSSGGEIHHQSSLLSLEPDGPTGFMMLPKNEPVVGGIDFSCGSRIGLNLGVRTYFSSDDDFVNRLYRRSRGVEAGSFSYPKCQAEGCNADLTHSKHYHRRHKVCEFHSKASTVIAAGLTQRFCQQCSRSFHQLSEFDNGKRSCRRRLADHNRRRRKSHQQANQENPNKSQLNRSSSENLLPRSSPCDSGIQTSSVTIAVSPSRIFSLDYGSF